MNIRIDYWYGENKVPVKIIKKRKPFTGNCVECKIALKKPMPYSLCKRCYDWEFCDDEYENSLNKNIFEQYERQ